MLLQFNWDRLDVTAAEAICALLNAKLEEELLLRRAANQSVNASGGQETASADAACGVESLRVTNIEWGNVPPFIEVVELDDAVEFASSTPLSFEAPLGQQDFGGTISSGTCGGGATTPFFLRPSPASSVTMMDGISETDSGIVGNHGGMPTPSVPPASGIRPGNGQSPINSSSAPVKDAFAAYFGPKGLYVCLHVTYGGPMRVSVASVLRHDVPLGPIAIPVRMPLQLHFSKMDMDFHLCINLHRNTCRVWMEPGKLFTSPLNRMNVMAVFGERRPSSQHMAEFPTSGQNAGDDLDTSDAWTHVGSSRIGSDDAEDMVFIDESIISQFVLKEVRAILQEKIIYPHSVVVPLSL
ncbi:uncharacterized protein TEOVI_000475800 [Trypanosoma equiperdum]|uniref:SMP-LTD domain-containing protein n=2 Tax=Trypanozoon TaxID=39700 RepID=Q384A5_TRYB2|nr:hypothetical protein, conserved [Trypanosoma brucei brucei TREU927]EAN79876.1 hypothetical protein, conserved [Trypanosoma brucei brucei TREU927]SCU65619.1 hypothetical protein, conserved [Trypanosoma equiperdum]